MLKVGDKVRTDAVSFYGSTIRAISVTGVINYVQHPFYRVTFLNPDSMTKEFTVSHIDDIEPLNDILSKIEEYYV